MILADKIIRLRKKNNWSQEELAEKMNVSRQAVSKWEGAQTIPDLEKILQLSALFGVTTDYLLKDEIEDEEVTEDASSYTTVKRISIEEANTYIEQRKKASWLIAFAAFLWIVSPIILILLSMLSGMPNAIVTETTANAVGFSVIFVFVLIAVPIHIYCGFKNQSYGFLDKNIPFELEYGVKGIITEKKNAFRKTYITCNIIATCVCICAIVPLVLLSFSDNEMLVAIGLSFLMVIGGIGAGMFIVVGVQNASMQKLLREGEFTEKEKKKTGIKESVSYCYWCSLVAIYLAWSFLTDQWHISWLVFAIGGVLFPIVMCICSLIADKRKKN